MSWVYTDKQGVKHTLINPQSADMPNFVRAISSVTKQQITVYHNEIQHERSTTNNTGAGDSKGNDGGDPKGL